MLLPCLASDLSNDMTWLVVTISRPVVGSSRKMMGGLLTSSKATASRFFWPPDSFSTCVFSQNFRFRVVMISSTWEPEEAVRYTFQLTHFQKIMVLCSTMWIKFCVNYNTCVMPQNIRYSYSKFYNHFQNTTLRVRLELTAHVPRGAPILGYIFQLTQFTIYTYYIYLLWFLVRITIILDSKAAQTLN